MPVSLSVSPRLVCPALPPFRPPPRRSSLLSLALSARATSSLARGRPLRHHIFLEAAVRRQRSHVHRYKGGSSAPRVCLCSRLRSWKYSIFTIREASVAGARESIRPLYPATVFTSCSLPDSARIALFLFLRFCCCRCRCCFCCSPLASRCLLRFHDLIEELSYEDGKLEKWRYRSARCLLRWLPACVYASVSRSPREKLSYPSPMFAPVLAKIVLLCISSRSSAITPALNLPTPTSLSLFLKGRGIRRDRRGQKHGQMARTGALYFFFLTRVFFEPSPSVKTLSQVLDFLETVLENELPMLALCRS